MTETEPIRYGHYTVGRLIGRGGMALVYTARNDRTGADVALKVVHRREGASSLSERFRHEAEISGKLAHPYIVRVYDFFVTEDGTSVLVMELLRGESLATFLTRRGKLSVAETLAVALPILEALHHTHRQGVIHRDVKASNIFLAVEANGAAVPKLLDFGIAKRPASGPALTAVDEVLGTPSSMSPEQIRGDTELDGRSDLFSFAGMLVELLTGQGPFHSPTASASLVAVLEREIDPPPEIPPQMFVEIERALRKRPIERHPSAEDLARALREACADESTDGALAVGISSMTVTENAPTLSNPPLPYVHTANGDSSPGNTPFGSRRGRARIAAIGLGGALLATVVAVVTSRQAARSDLAPAAPAPTAIVSTASLPATPLAAATATPTAEAVASGSASVLVPKPTTISFAPKPASPAAPKPSPPKPVATRPDF